MHRSSDQLDPNNHASGQLINRAQTLDSPYNKIDTMKGVYNNRDENLTHKRQYWNVVESITDLSLAAKSEARAREGGADNDTAD